MPLLNILADVDSVLQNPAWILLGLAGCIGFLGLIALLVLYHMSRD